MNSIEINQKLYNLYAEKIPVLLGMLGEDALKTQNLSCPLLPYIFEDYTKAANKILFIGKETNSWQLINQYKHLSIDDFINIVRSWYLNFDFNRNIRKNKWSYNSAFWRFCHEVSNQLNPNLKLSSEYKDFSREFVWLNQCRLDESAATPAKTHFSKILKWSYELLEKEIEILQPDTIILMGNDHYWTNVKWIFDKELKHNLDYIPIGIGKYSESVNIIKSSFFPENINVFWIRHPERKSSREVEEMRAKIIETIKINLKVDFMKIITTFVKGLYAFKFDNKLDELERLLDDWNNFEYLESFFEQNESDLSYFGIDIDTAIAETINEANKLETLLLKLSSNNSIALDYIFRPLDNLEFREISLSKQKASRRWLRLYAIKIESNHYVITGGAIKLTHKMQEREHTQNELNKLEKCRSYLQSQDVFDIDSFNELAL
jgi:hypothetical protein